LVNGSLPFPLKLRQVSLLWHTCIYLNTPAEDTFLQNNNIVSIQTIYCHIIGC